jgi:hypothetical protein
MVQKETNPYMTPRGRNYQQVPQEREGLEQLAHREGVETRRAAKAKQILNDLPDRMAVMMADATNDPPELRDLENLRTLMHEQVQLMAAKDRQIAELNRRVEALTETFRQSNNVGNSTPQPSASRVVPEFHQTLPQPTLREKVGHVLTRVPRTIKYHKLWLMISRRERDVIMPCWIWFAVVRDGKWGVSPQAFELLR